MVTERPDAKASGYLEAKTKADPLVGMTDGNQRQMKSNSKGTRALTARDTPPFHCVKG